LLCYYKSAKLAVGCRGGYRANNCSESYIQGNSRSLNIWALDTLEPTALLFIMLTVRCIDLQKLPIGFARLHDLSLFEPATTTCAVAHWLEMISRCAVAHWLEMISRCAVAHWLEMISRCAVTHWLEMLCRCLSRPLQLVL